MAAARVFALNAHAQFACQHSGACCTAGWSIPVEAHLLALVGTDSLEPGADGACQRYDSASGMCDLHRDHGEQMLPESCHHFPRRALLDPRGTFVTLSHFCPTAASLLLDSTEPLRVIEHPAAFPAARGYEGLDARDEWPPLVRPDALFDHDSFARWERHLVETLDGSAQSVQDTLLALAATAEQLRAWQLAEGPLLEWTEQQLASAAHQSTATGVSARYDKYAGRSAFEHVLEAVPRPLLPAELPGLFEEIDAQFVSPEWDRMARLALRFLAARAFASWTAYQSHGLRTQVAELFMTAAVLRVECVRACATTRQPLNRQSFGDAVRFTDRLLVHLVDRDRLLPWLGEAELDASAHRRGHR